MKYIVYVVLLLLLPSLLHGQQKEITLNGYIALEGGSSFTYKIVFTDSDGYVSGYSLTSQKANSEIRAGVKGYINKNKHSLEFLETAIEYNHGFESDVTLCLVNANLQLKQNNSGNILAGRFTSGDASNTFCSKGTVTFINSDVINALFDNTAPKDTIATIAKPVQKTNSHIKVVYADPPPQKTYNYATPAKPAVDEITTGIDKEYEWHTDTVVIKIWDGGNVDGDVVTLFYNDKALLKNYTLVADKKELRVPVSAIGADIITIIAGNEGNEPPNTANISLTDGSVVYNILAYNKIGQKALIRIKRAAVNSEK